MWKVGHMWEVGHTWKVGRMWKVGHMWKVGCTWKVAHTWKNNCTEDRSVFREGSNQDIASRLRLDIDDQEERRK